MNVIVLLELEPSTSSMMLSNRMFQEKLCHLDLFFGSLNGDHSLVIVVHISDSYISPTLSCYAAYSFTPGTNNCPCHIFLNGHLLCFFLAIIFHSFNTSTKFAEASIVFFFSSKSSSTPSSETSTSSAKSKIHPTKSTSKSSSSKSATTSTKSKCSIIP